MRLLIAGLIIFLVPHSIAMVNESWRNRMAARLGEQRWQGLFSLFALTGLTLIVWGYSLARQDPVHLYTPSANLRYLTFALMLAYFPIAIAGYMSSRLRDAVKHPLLVSTILWAAAHLLSNGTAADLLLFGGFLLWSSADLWSMRRRLQKPIPVLPRASYNDLLAITLGLALYAATLLWLHAWVIRMPLL